MFESVKGLSVRVDEMLERELCVQFVCVTVTFSLYRAY